MLDQTTSAMAFIGLVRTLRSMVAAARSGNKDEVYSYAQRLCTFNGSSRTITSAEPVAGEDGSTCIAAFFKFTLDAERYAPPRAPRLFDILVFGAMRLMDQCGTQPDHGFYFSPPAQPYLRSHAFYLRFGNGGRHASETFLVTRVVSDRSGAPAADYAESHHNCLLRNLAPLGEPPRAGGKPKWGRAQAITLAERLFAKSHPDGLGGVAAEDVRRLLTDLLKAADTFHGGVEVAPTRMAIPFDQLTPATPGEDRADMLSIPCERHAMSQTMARVHEEFSDWREEDLDARWDMYVYTTEDIDEDDGSFKGLLVYLRDGVLQHHLTPTFDALANSLALPA